MPDWIGSVDLRDRVNGEWSRFETELFNAVTKFGPDDPKLLFSGRLRLTEAAIRGIRAELELMQAERDAGLPFAGRIG